MVKDEMYYIRARGYAGDCLLWWRKGRCGYTANLDEALVVDADEAASITSERDRQDEAYLVSEIDRIAVRHADSERLGGVKPAEVLRG